MVDEVKPVNLWADERWPWLDKPFNAMGPNIVMSKLAEVALKAADPTRNDIGDSIDRGLIVLRLLNEAGFELWLAKADAIASLGGVQDRGSGSVAGCADAQSVLPRRSQGVATPSEGALEALRNHQQQLDQDGVMVGVSRQALDECLAAFAPELTADFTRSLPGGKLDDSEYEAIESALDKADAPCQGPGGRWLTLAERIAALVPEGVAIKPEADGEASKPKVRATEHKDDSNPLTREGG